MSHLGDLTSAVVDGELTGAEFDRASAHLAACAACRAEAAQMRWLKRELRALAEVDGAEALTRRLLAMPGPRDPLGPRSLRRASGAGYRPHGRAYRYRGRHAVWGAVSLVVAGVSAVAFGLGGGTGSGSGGAVNERPVTPQLEMLDLQHAATTGGVPLGDSRKMPAGAAARP